MRHDRHRPARHSPGTAAEQQRDRAMALLPEVADRGVPRPRLRHHLTRVLTGAVALSLLAAVFGGFWAYHWWDTNVGDQHPVPAPQFTDAQQARFASSAEQAGDAPAGTGAEPVVLTYHDISPDAHGSDYVVSPKRFAAEMKMLHRAGYHTLGAADVLRYRQGGDVPPRSVVITFDDGTKGLWTYADPVLERYGFSAISFLITGRVGTHQPYYLTWPEVSRMQASGRWDFESHTHALHRKIGPEGDRSSVLTTRRTTDGRREGLAGFRARISGDLNRSIRDFAAHDLPRPRLFAWPYSDIRGDQGDPAAARAAAKEVHRLFPVAFVDAYRPEPASRQDARNDTVQRLEVFADDTAESVFRGLQQMSTLPVQPLSPATRGAAWLEDGGHRAPIDASRLEDDVVTPEARSLTYLAAYWAPQRTGRWTGYRLGATVVPPADGDGAPGVIVRGDDSGRVVVRISATTASVSAHGDTVAARNLADHGDTGAEHTVVATVTGTGTRVVVDGTPLTTVSASGGNAARGGIGVVFGRDSPDGAWGSVRDLRVRPAS